MKNIPTDKLIELYPEAKKMIEKIDALCHHFGEHMDEFRINNKTIIRYVFFDVATQNVHIGYETGEKLN